MKISITFLLFFLFTYLTAQNSQKSEIEFNFGWAKHGTGDINGYLYGFHYQQSFSKRVYWILGFEGTLHDDPNGDPLFFEYEGKTWDGTIRYVTAGMQFVIGSKYNFIETPHSSMGILGLPFLRYQATSINDIIATQYPAGTGFPYPIRVLLNEGPSRTWAVGGALRLNYNYRFNKGLYLGMIAGFQSDTNGDTLINAGLTFGKVFSLANN